MTNYAVTEPATGDVVAVPAEEDTVAGAAATPTDGDSVENSQPAEDAVGGPEVVTTVDAAPAEEAPAAFDGTASSEDRAKDHASDAEILAKRAEESKDVAAAQRAADLEFATNNPNSPVARPANPAVGGESF